MNRTCKDDYVFRTRLVTEGPNHFRGPFKKNAVIFPDDNQIVDSQNSDRTHCDLHSPVASV